MKLLVFGKVGYALRTLSLLKGLPVFELESGEQLGEVCDLSMTDAGTVNGLLIKSGTILKKLQFIQTNHVTSFGSDGVMIKNKNLLKPVQEDNNYTFSHHHRLLGKEMMTAEGERLGVLEDVYFLEEVGTIIGYELTDGFFSDVMEGKRVIKPVHPLSIGKDTIIVNVEN